MLMNRLSPLHLLNEMQQAFNLFEGAATSQRPLAPAGYPPISAWSDDQNFYLEAELPGMSLEQLEIFVTDSQTLTIKGRREECRAEGATWLQRERGFGAFERQITLPGAIDSEGVDATLAEGVLTILLPKARELRPRRITVKAR